MLTADSVLQENTGATAPGTADSTTVAVTLPAGTTAGTTVVVFLPSVNGNLGLTLPTGWVLDASTQSATSGIVAAHKSKVAAGETSWTFTASSAQKWAWYVAEVDGLDPDNPLDASAIGGTIVTQTPQVWSIGPTGQNAGTDTLLFAVFADQSGTGPPGSWSGYTGGFVEAAQVESTRTDGTGSSNFGLAVTRKLSGGATTGPFSSSATYTLAGTGDSFLGAIIVVYRAVDSPVVNPLTWQLGFEHGMAYGLTASTAVGTPLASGPAFTAGTDLIVQAASARGSAYGCRIVQAANIRYIANPITLPAKALVGGFDIRVVSATGTAVVAEMQPASGSILQLVYDATNTRFGLRWGAAGTVAWQAGTTALNTWAWVDIRFTGVTTATWHADWTLETAPGVHTAQPSPADLTGQASGIQITGLRLGGNVTQTVTLDLDNIVACSYASGYPLGPHTLQAVKVDPAATPTASGTVGNFALVTNNATGAALTAGTLTAARDAIDDIPPVISAASDGVVQTTTAAADYLQFPLDTIVVGPTRVISGARVLACFISTTGAGAGALGVRGWDGAAEASVFAISSTPGSSTTLSNTTPPWGGAQWNPPGGWTQAKLDAAALRIGFSSDATPDMGVHAVCVEVALRAATVARQVSAEGGLFTVNLNLSPYSSASVSYDVASADPTRGATFSYSVAGVAQTPVYVPAASSVTVPVAADLFGDISDVTLTPDPAA